MVGAGNRLTAVVATHRHADHISGFATDGRTGKFWRNHQGPASAPGPAAVDRGPEGAAGRGDGDDGYRRQEGIRGAADEHERLAERVQQLAESKPAWMSATVRRELAFLGEDNLANKSAVNNLIAMGEDGAAKFLRYGDRDRTRKVAARRESTGARSAGSHPEQCHSEAAVQGQGSVLALRQGRGAGLPPQAKTARRVKTRPAGS